MATTTPNFGWPVPTSTDLVKDGATAIEALGDGIDTSMVDLKGGTTGQILAKATNADMDFAWITNDVGDITEVTAGTGISGGGTSGAVTITNSMATAIDAKGDLVAGTGADAFARLAVGANGLVLTADSTAATGLNWASQKVVQIVYGSTTTETTSSSATLADSTLTATITPTSASNKVLVLVNQNGVYKTTGDTAVYTQLQRAGTGIGNINVWSGYTASAVTNSPGSSSIAVLDSPATTSATIYKTQFASTNGVASAIVQFGSALSTIILIEVTP